MMVYQLTYKQAINVLNKEFNNEDPKYKGQLVNVGEDADGNFFVSKETVNNCNIPSVSKWFVDLNEIEHNPIRIDDDGNRIN